MLTRLKQWLARRRTKRDFQRMHTGTAAAFEVGRKVHAKNGISPKLVEAIRLSIENDKKLAERRAQFDAESG